MFVLFVDLQRVSFVRLTNFPRVSGLSVTSPDVRKVGLLLCSEVEAHSDVTQGNNKLLLPLNVLKEGMGFSRKLKQKWK